MFWKQAKNEASEATLLLSLRRNNILPQISMKTQDSIEQTSRQELEEVPYSKIR